MPLLSCQSRTSPNSGRTSPSRPASSRASFPTEYLLFMAFLLHLGIYDFHGNGFHSTSFVPVFLIFVLQALQEFLKKSGYFSF